MKVGILGGGQLALMMVDSFIDKNVEFIVLDPSDKPPASKRVKCIKAKYDDTEYLDFLAKECDVVTIDFENVPSSSLNYLEKQTKVYPNSKSVEICQDRLKEKNLFRECGVPVTDFYEINDIDDLKNAVSEITNKSILKSRFMGYDGKNQVHLNDKKIEEAFTLCGSKDLILEKKVDFITELSLIGARTQDGDTVYYPLVENNHNNGILDYSIAPYENEELQKKAEEYHKVLCDKMNYVGILVIEFFLINNQELIANEMAPRVHNSGHWTIEGANISQFEAHIRCIINEQISDIEMNKYSGMVNIISKMPKDKAEGLSDISGFHDYGKLERENRKLGHITLIDTNKNNLLKKIENIKKII